METFSGRSWEIPGNVRKLELSKTLVDHKNALVFYQEVSGKSSWSFLTGEPNTKKKKTVTKHQFIALSAVWREKQVCFFGDFFCLSAIFWPHSSAIFHPNTVNPEFFVCTKFSNPSDPRPFVRMKFSYSRWPLRILWLALNFFSMHFIFVRKPTRTKYMKIKCIRNILDLQYPHNFLLPVISIW